MRIDPVAAPPVTPPDVRPDVGVTRRVAPVTAQTVRGELPPVAQSEAREASVQAPPAAERRQDVRRSVDRRKRQLPVLIDTRVSQRRRTRRRVADAAPSTIDIEA